MRNRVRLDFIKKDDAEKFIKQQSNISCKGIHKSYEKCDSYTFKQKEVSMHKLTYLGVAIIELSNF